MLSLRVAVILALSTTRFDCYGVCGNTVTVPYSAEDPSSGESVDSVETTTPLDPDYINSPIIETATLPTIRSSDHSSSVASSSSSVSISGSSHVGGNSCICRECSPENGCFIKHFRQYNYYYPNGRKVTLPCQHSDLIHPITAGESSTHDDTSDASNKSSTNDNDIVKVKTSAKPTSRHHLPGVNSYVPNNGFNYVHHNLASVYRKKDKGQTLDQSNDDNDGEHASSDESAEQTTEPSSSDDETTTSSSPDDDNMEEDIITYLTEPHMFGHTRRTVIKNGNNRNFQTKHITTSSRMQSKSSKNSEPQHKVGTTSSTQSQPQQQSSMTSNTHSQHSSSSSGSEPQQQDKTSSILHPQSLLGFGPAINWPGDINFGSANRMTVGFNPFFQTQPLGVSPAILQPPTPPQLPVPAFQNKINWLGGSPPATQAFQPAPCPYFNPVRTWPNMPASLPLFDFGNMSPSYSVIL